MRVIIAALLTLSLAPSPALCTPAIKVTSTLTLPKGNHVSSLKWSPAGGKLVGHQGRTVTVWDLKPGAKTRAFQAESPVWHLEWGANSEELVYTTTNRSGSSVIKYDLETGHHNVIAQGNRGMIRGFSRSAKGTFIFAGDQFGREEDRFLALNGSGDMKGSRWLDEPVIWTEFGKDRTEQLWYGAGNGQSPRLIPWGYDIYATVVPNVALGLVALQTFIDNIGKTVIIDLGGSIQHELSITFMPHHWNSHTGELLGCETKDGMNDIIESAIAVFNPNTGSYTKLTSGLDLDDAPVWSPDGAQIAFYRSKAGLVVIGAVVEEGEQ